MTQSRFTGGGRCPAKSRSPVQECDAHRRLRPRCSRRGVRPSVASRISRISGRGKAARHMGARVERDGATVYVDADRVANPEAPYENGEDDARQRARARAAGRRGSDALGFRFRRVRHRRASDRSAPERTAAARREDRPGARIRRGAGGAAPRSDHPLRSPHRDRDGKPHDGGGARRGPHGPGELRARAGSGGAGGCAERDGARIQGAGSSVVTIDGVNSLRPMDIQVIPDRIEAGTCSPRR